MHRRIAALGAATLLAVTAAPAIAGTMTFKSACADKSGPEEPAARKSITIAAVGDLLFHMKLLSLAAHKKAGFKPFWKPLASVLRDADLTYGNLEGPAAEGVAIGGRAVKDPGFVVDRRVYGYQPPFLIFNYHPSVIQDIKDSGFDVVSTANNHALDRGSLGVDRTIANLEKSNLAFTGTRKKGETARPWSTITQSQGIKVAWLACTFNTNGMPDRDHQALLCFGQTAEVLGEIKRLSQSTDVDAVILTPHWGEENSHTPTRQQRELARAAIDAGAAAVLAAHPHVLQPWEKHATADGREGLIVYSLGNFVSNQIRPAQRVGAVALVELTKQRAGKAVVSRAGYIPTWFAKDGGGYRVTEAPPVSYAGKLAAKVYPAGNRVLAASFRDLPSECGKPGEAVIASTADAVPHVSTQAMIAAIAATPADKLALADQPATDSSAHTSSTKRLTTRGVRAARGLAAVRKIARQTRVAAQNSTQRAGGSRRRGRSSKRQAVAGLQSGFGFNRNNQMRMD